MILIGGQPLIRAVGTGRGCEDTAIRRSDRGCSRLRWTGACETQTDPLTLIARSDDVVFSALKSACECHGFTSRCRSFSILQPAVP